MSTKKKFDFAFSLGASCFCSQTLRNLGLQFASFPFDWIGDTTLTLRTNFAIGVGRENWLRKETLHLEPQIKLFSHDSYRDSNTDVLFPHDFPKGQPFDDAFEAIRKKYARRFARLDECLANARSVLIAWVGDPRDRAHSWATDESIAACLETFSKRYPKTTFTMVALTYLEGVPSTSPHISRGKNYLHVAFDYRKRGNANDATSTWAVVREDLVSPYFKDFRVKDYRTPEEKKAYIQKKRQAKYARFAATNAWDYFWAKMQFKIYNHFRKALIRRGMNLEKAK